MDQSPSPAITLTLEEKVAKLCVRPRLHSDVLPRFVLIMLEHALHRFMCSFAACFMALIEKYRRGELEPWPDEDEACDEPCVSKHKQKLTPAARMRRAGASHAQILADAVPAIGERESLVGTAMQAGSMMPPAAWPYRGQRRVWGGEAWRGQAARVRSADRCRTAMFCSAAGMRRETCVQIVPFS